MHYTLLTNCIIHITDMSVKDFSTSVDNYINECIKTK